MLYRTGLTLMLLVACAICLTQVTQHVVAKPVTQDQPYFDTPLAANGSMNTSLVQ